MKKRWLIFLLSISYGLHAQDTVSLQKVRFEMTFPGQVGFVIGNFNRTGPLPEHAEILLNNSKGYGAHISISGDLFFFNKIFLFAGYSYDYLATDKRKIQDEFAVCDSRYFVQPEPPYYSVETVSYSQYAVKYGRFGLGLSFRQRSFRYVQPYGFYAIGTGIFPSGKFAFRDYASNNFHVNDYGNGSQKSSGFGFGVRLRHYDDGQPAARWFAHVGIVLEYAHMSVTGKARVLQTDGLTLAETSIPYEISKTYDYFTIGFSAGFGIKNKRYSKSVFFPPRK